MSCSPPKYLSYTKISPTRLECGMSLTNKSAVGFDLKAKICLKVVCQNVGRSGFCTLATLNSFWRSLPQTNFPLGFGVISKNCFEGVSSIFRCPLQVAIISTNGGARFCLLKTKRNEPTKVFRLQPQPEIR